jgi:hypothetical protein
VKKKDSKISYKDSTKCFLQFQDIDGQEPPIEHRLAEILAGNCMLSKTEINYDKLAKDAKEKKIFLVRLVLIDGERNVVKIVNLDNCEKESKWLIPRSQYSYIEYKHEFTSPYPLPNITVKNFLNRGFPVKKDVIDGKYLKELASKQQVTIKKLIFHNTDGVVESEVTPPFISNEMSVPNRKLCTVIYEAKWSKDANLEIRLDNLLSRKTFPRIRISVLSLEELEKCVGFTDVTIIGFQSDKSTNKIQPVNMEEFIQYPYSNQKLCFIYYLLQLDPQTLRSVRLDHLLDRGYFPHMDLDVSQGDESQQIPQQMETNGEKTHAPVQQVIDDPEFLKMAKDIQDYLYSFTTKTCVTCEKKWYVTEMPVAGNVKLEALDPRKNKYGFRFSNLNGNECDFCASDNPPPGLPKMFSAENNMHFGPTFPEIDALNYFEEMLLAKVTTLVSVVTLTSTGYLSFQGHSVHFFQKTTEWFNTIPKRASACPVIMIVRKGAPAGSARKAFTCRRMILLAAARCMIKYNKLYEGAFIDTDYLNTIPEDGMPSDH